MKTLKNVLLWIAIIIIVLVIIAYFLPRQVHIERTATINAPVKIVYNQINDLHSWEKWATWNQIDPDMQIEYINHGIGKDGGYKWSSEMSNVGSGTLILTESIPYDSIATMMDFMGHGTASGYFLFKAEDEKTNVTWAFESDLGMNPMARWMGLMMDSMLGSDLKKGLDNLNVVCETIVEENRPVIEIANKKKIDFIGIRETISWPEIGIKMGEMYGKIMMEINTKKLTMTGMPLAIYHAMKEESIDLECAIPIIPIKGINTKMNIGFLKEGNYATATHIGSYETLEKTHTAIQSWIQKHKFNLTGAPIEVYITDPQSDPDPGKWITEIYYPI